jgi:acetolactate synthase small subunit
MNIARFALSITLLASVASISAHEGCQHASESVETTTVAATTSIADIVKQATEDFNLTDAEITELTARLEAAGEDADVAAIVAEIRTENSVTTEQKTAEVTELI